MPSEFRPTSPEDGAELVALAERQLGVVAGDPMFALPHLRWKYWAPWRSSALARSHVLVREGRIVAHAAVLPLTCEVQGQTLTLLHPFDWMSDPSAIGSGAALLARLAKVADGLLIVGGSAMTQRMVKPLGFRELGEVTHYRAPVTTFPDPAADGFRDSPPLSLSTTTRPTAEECAGAPPPEPWLAFQRTPARLADCIDCPAAPTSVYTVRRGDTLLGGFVLTFAPSQARITALWTTRQDAETDAERLASLIHLARVEASSRPGVAEVVCMATLPSEQDALATCGFHATGSVPMFLLASPRQLPLDRRVSFQMLDGDLAFLHHGA